MDGAGLWDLLGRPGPLRRRGGERGGDKAIGLEDAFGLIGLGKVFGDSNLTFGDSLYEEGN